MSNQQSWWAIGCCLSALTIVIAVSLSKTPIERAASRLRIGMNSEEVIEALSPEVAYRHPRFISWNGFTVTLDNGLRMTFQNDKLTEWQLGRSLPDDTELERAKEKRLRSLRAGARRG
jgi:hypothetical protein